MDVVEDQVTFVPDRLGELQCVECKKEPAEKQLVIGTQTLDLCSGCYEKVEEKVRPLNRLGKRTQTKAWKVENRKRRVSNRYRVRWPIDPNKEVGTTRRKLLGIQEGEGDGR